MSDYEALVEGYGPAPADPTLRTGETPSSREGSAVGAEEGAGFDTDEPPHEDDDWPEPPAEIPLHPLTDELRSLRSDHRPEPGRHYVIFGGVPRPVIRAFASTEDEFVRSQIDPVESLKDPDGQRRVRADRTLRLRYRGYVCGEMSSL